MASNRSSPQTIESSDPQTVSSELSAQTPVTVLSSQTPEYAMAAAEFVEVSDAEAASATIEHVSSSSDELEVLEAQAEMRERLANASVQTVLRHRGAAPGQRR